MSREPTFANKWDRITYLIAEYKVLVAGMIVGSGVWFVYANPQLPALPEWVGLVSTAWVLFAIPCYLAGKKIALWLRNRNFVTVYHVNAVDESLEKYLVPPATWTEKTVEGPDPYPVNGGDAWAVREWHHDEETDALAVRGVWLSEVEDTKLLTSQRHMEDIHDNLMQKERELSSVRDRISLMGNVVQEKGLNAAAEARERGTMLDQTAVKDAVDDAKQQVDDLGTDELPKIEESAEEVVGDLSDLSPGAGEPENGQQEAMSMSEADD